MCVNRHAHARTHMHRYARSGWWDGQGRPCPTKSGGGQPWHARGRVRCCGPSTLHRVRAGRGAPCAPAHGGKTLKMESTKKRVVVMKRGKTTNKRLYFLDSVSAMWLRTVFFFLFLTKGVGGCPHCFSAPPSRCGVQACACKGVWGVWGRVVVGAQRGGVPFTTRGGKIREMKVGCTTGGKRLSTVVERRNGKKINKEKSPRTREKKKNKTKQNKTGVRRGSVGVAAAPVSASVRTAVVGCGGDGTLAHIHGAGESRHRFHAFTPSLARSVAAAAAVVVARAPTRPPGPQAPPCSAASAP